MKRKKMQVSIDESTNIEEFNTVNVLIKTLQLNSPEKIVLFIPIFLKKSIIAQFSNFLKNIH